MNQASTINLQTARELQNYIERIERLEEEKRDLGGDIKDVFAEAKGRGFDIKALRRVISARRKDESDRQTEDSVFETYMAALGMLADTPLGEAAITRALIEDSTVGAA